MRIRSSKTAALALLTGATLALGGCGKGEPANAVDTNMTDLSTVDSSAGMANDASAMDSMATDANIAGGEGAETVNAANAM